MTRRRDFTLWAVLIVAIAIWMVPPGPQHREDRSESEAEPQQQGQDNE